MAEKNVDISSFTEDQREMSDVIVEFLRDSSRRELRIGGVAGTGKTSVIALLPEFAGRAGLHPDVSYCAFTGKAASVMRGKGMPATTIHSLIYHADVHVNEETHRVEYEFGLKGKGEVDGDVIVVDEASTVSQQLYHDLMKLGRKVIFVGDYGQLPPIGTDVNLMQEDRLDFRLAKIHRQAEKSDIIRLSMAVRNGDRVAFHQGGETAKVHLGETSVEEMLRYSQVLCGYNSTRTWLNSEIRKAYGFRTELPERKDKMTFLMNSRKTGTFNGQQFIVLSCRKAGEDFVVEYVDVDDGDAGAKRIRILGKALGAAAGMQSVMVTRKDLERCPQSATFAYVVTVHKAQGSEWPKVALWDSPQAFTSDPDVRRRYLYTAVTRASKYFLWVAP